MLLRSLLAPLVIYPPLAENSRRGYFLRGEFPVLPCPEVEDVFLNQKRCSNFPMEFQPFLAAGVARAVVEGCRTGKRLCSLRVEVDRLKFHDVDSSAEGLEIRTFYCMQDLWEQATPIEPLPAAWKTTEVLAVARGYLDGGHDDYLPILADALEEAGCDRSLILTHLRTCPDHGARCWVLDLLVEEGNDRLPSQP